MKWFAVCLSARTYTIDIWTYNERCDLQLILTGIIVMLYATPKPKALPLSIYATLYWYSFLLLHLLCLYSSFPVVLCLPLYYLLYYLLYHHFYLFFYVIIQTSCMQYQSRSRNYAINHVAKKRIQMNTSHLRQFHSIRQLRYLSMHHAL